jgi:hypothetical protein
MRYKDKKADELFERGKEIYLLGHIIQYSS